MKSLISAPLIGPWLYQRSVRDLANRAQMGEVKSVRTLTRIFCEYPHAKVQDIARKALCSLTSVPALDAFCAEILIQSDAALNNLNNECHYLPSDPVSRALFCFVTGQYEHYDRLDNNPHRPLLASGYALATERVRFNTRYAAKMSKHCPVLGAALRGTDQTAKTARWSDEEWEVVVIGLIQEQKWRALWQLSVHAPLPMAIHALTAMEKAGWAPEGDERTLWEEIIRIIPDRWTCPVPENLLVRAHLTTERQPQRLAISGDGSLLAAGCSDGTICLWNTRNAMLVFQIYPGPGSISGLAISPDTTRLIFKETSGTLQCRDTVEGTLQWSVGTIGTPVPFSCSYDGKKVMIPGDEGQIHIVNITDGKTQLISGGDKASVTCCSQSHDNQFCAVGHADGSVGCWDLKGKHYLRTLEGLGDPVSSISFSEGGDECLVIYQRNLPARWKISTGKRSRV